MSNSFDVLAQLDRIASSAFDTARAPRPMPVDLFRDGDQYVLSADLPGIDPDSVDLDVDGQLLTIRAERQAPVSEHVRWLTHERPYGSYMRQFTLGNGVDVQGITANLLLAAQADGTFTAHEISAPAMHRGAAFADFDADGRIDAVVTRIGAPPLLLRNTAGVGNHWIALRLPIGARVRIVTASGEQWDQVTTSVGYASSSEPLVHFGLGKETRVKLIEIRWPSGKTQRLENVEADRYHTPRE